MNNLSTVWGSGCWDRPEPGMSASHHTDFNATTPAEDVIVVDLSTKTSSYGAKHS